MRVHLVRFWYCKLFATDFGEFWPPDSRRYVNVVCMYIYRLSNSLGSDSPGIRRCAGMSRRVQAGRGCAGKSRRCVVVRGEVKAGVDARGSPGGLWMSGKVQAGRRSAWGSPGRAL